MRIRSTKPEFYRSKTIAELSWSDRHVLKALESYVDDNGVGKDDVTLFAADAFPRDVFRSAPETFRSLSRALDAFAELGLIVRYEDAGENLLYIDRWAERQRIDKPSRGRFRRPDGTLEYSEPVDRSQFANISGALPKVSERVAPGTGEQGNRGTVEQDSCASADAERDSDLAGDFEQWWETYPRKRGKGQALKAYRTARKTATAEDLIDAVASQRVTLTAKGPDFVPYPATWLNGQRWLDEIETGTPADEHPYAHLPAPKNWDAIRAEAQASRGGAS